MAAPTDVELVRDLAGVVEDDYDDAYIDDLIDRSGSSFGAVSLLWHIRAAEYHSLVAASSGSTSLQMQQRYEHAREQAQEWGILAGGLSESEIMESVQMATATSDDSTEYSWGEGHWPAAGLWGTWEDQ